MADSNVSFAGDSATITDTPAILDFTQDYTESPRSKAIWLGGVERLATATYLPTGGYGGQGCMRFVPGRNVSDEGNPLGDHPGGVGQILGFNDIAGGSQVVTIGILWRHGSTLISESNGIKSLILLRGGGAITRPMIIPKGAWDGGGTVVLPACDGTICNTREDIDSENYFNEPPTGLPDISANPSQFVYTEASIDLSVTPGIFHVRSWFEDETEQGEHVIKKYLSEEDGGHISGIDIIGYYNSIDDPTENCYLDIQRVEIHVGQFGPITPPVGFPGSLREGDSGEDTTPSAFHFTDQTDVERSSTITSAAITVSGIDAPATITVTGGTYDINGSGDFTSDPGTVEVGDTVRARHTSSASYSTATNTAVTIGGVSDTFTSITEADPSSDTTPDAFSFTDQSDVARSTVITSAAITVAGIDAPATISVSGGTYDINGSGTFVSSPGTVEVGDTVRARHTSSSSYGTATNTVITIGGVSDTFTSTTEENDTPVPAYRWFRVPRQ